MDANLLKCLTELSVQAKQLDVREVSPFKDLLIKNEEGQWDYRPAAVKPREQEAYDLETIAKFAHEKSNGEVWFSRQGVTIFLDRDQRYDKVTFEPEFSPEMTSAFAMESNKRAISQQDLRKELKTTFERCVPGTLVAAVSRLKFAQSDEGTAAIERSKASIGKTLRAEFSGEEDIPEYPIFCLSVMKSPVTVKVGVKFWLEPDPRTRMFEFYPMPGELEAACQEYEDHVRQRLKEMLPKDYPLFYGNP